MDAMTYSDARAKLARTMEQVCDQHEAVIITRRKAGSVVLMSLADYEALRETAYLLRSPANARRLIDAIEEVEAHIKRRPRSRKRT
jgi:antitoxin YefM